MSALPPVPVAPPVAIPSDRAWLDPRLVNAILAPRYSTLVLSFNVITPLVVPNPNRWGVGFFKLSGATLEQWAPWPDLNVASWPYSTAQYQNLWYTLPELGSLVCSGWWGRSSTGATVRVVELIRS
jgi:hypothetical protein